MKLLAAVLAATTLSLTAFTSAGPAAGKEPRVHIIDTVWVMVDHPSVQVTFTRSGDFARFGCNSGRGDAKFKKDTKDNGTYRSRPWSSTRKMCDEPAMLLERRVKTALSTNATWVRSGATLTLTTPTDTLIFHAQGR